MERSWRTLHDDRGAFLAWARDGMVIAMPIGIAYDELRSLLVIARDHTGTDEEYGRFVEALQKLDRDAHARGAAPVCILSTRRDTPAPNATWRRRFGEIAASNLCPNLFFALITESAVQRGVLSVVRWLQGEKGGVAEPFETWEQAVAAAERFRKEPLPALATLRTRAHQVLSTGQP